MYRSPVNMKCTRGSGNTNGERVRIRVRKLAIVNVDPGGYLVECDIDVCA
jgi:hypothetical protein